MVVAAGGGSVVVFLCVVVGVSSASTIEVTDPCLIASISKGANIFNGHSGIWHLHDAHLAHYHMPPNTDCDP